MVLLMEFGDYAMMRRMLRGIRERAEAEGNALPESAVPTIALALVLHGSVGVSVPG
jgi:hypothetical protein